MDGSLDGLYMEPDPSSSSACYSDYMNIDNRLVAESLYFWSRIKLRGGFQGKNFSV